MVSPQYKNAGSAPVGEQAPIMSAPDIPDPLELSPFQYAMAEKRAEQSKRKNDLGTIMAAASQGIGPEELSRERDRADLYNRSMSMAEQTMQASDEEFEEILNRLDSMPPEDAPMLVRSGVDRYDQIAAGIAMLMDKKHAAGYASVPGMMRDQRDAQTNTDLMNQFKVRAANSATVREGLEKRLGYAELRRRQASGALFDTVQKREDAEVEAQTDARNHAQSLELEGARATNRINLKRVDAMIAGLKSSNPAIRMEAAAAFYRGDVDAVEAYGKLSPAEQNALANAEYTAGPKTENTEAKTKTENAMREPRLKKLDADVDKVLQSIKTDSARMKQIEAKTARIPEEFRLRWANAAKRLSGGTVSGREGISALKDIKSIANARIKRVQDSIKAQGLLVPTGEMLAELQDATQDRDAAEAQILALSKMAGSTGGTARRTVDTSGGAKALKSKAAPKNPGWKVEIE